MAIHKPRAYISAGNELIIDGQVVCQLTMAQVDALTSEK